MTFILLCICYLKKKFLFLSLSVSPISDLSHPFTNTSRATLRTKWFPTLINFNIEQARVPFSNYFYIVILLNRNTVSILKNTTNPSRIIDIALLVYVGSFYS